MGQRVNGQVITKSELIERLGVKQSHLLIKDVDSAVKYILEYLSKSLGMGKRIEIRGFGSFSLRQRKARIARNPKTGAPVPMVGKSIPYFRPGKPLRDRVRNSVSSLSAELPPVQPALSSPQQEPVVQQDFSSPRQESAQDSQQDPFPPPREPLPE